MTNKKPDSNPQKMYPFTLQGLLVMSVIVIGIGLTIFNDFERLGVLRSLLGTLFGAFYALVLLWYPSKKRTHAPEKQHLAFLLIALTCYLAVNLLIGPGILWLIGMPLAGIASDTLLSRWRFFMYLLIPAIYAIPIGAIYGHWATAVQTFLMLGTFVWFIGLFSRLLTSEAASREKAETLATELSVANTQLRQYAGQIEQLAITQERNRMAREIHDSLGHYLTITNMQLAAASAVMATDPDKAQAAIEKAQRMTKDGLNAIRQSVSALREGPTGSRSLPEALKALVAEGGVMGQAVEIKVLGREHDLNPKQRFTLYRAAQEGLTNARKYAPVAQVTLTLDYQTENEVALTVADDGAGVGIDDKSEDGFGLIGIRERANLLNGTLDIQSGLGRGFQMCVKLPINENK